MRPPLQEPLIDESQPTTESKKVFPYYINETPTGIVLTAGLVSFSVFCLLYLLTITRKPEDKLSSIDQEDAFILFFAFSAAFDVFNEMLDHTPTAVDMLTEAYAYTQKNGFWKFVTTYELSHNCADHAPLPVDMSSPGAFAPTTRRRNLIKEIKEKETYFSKIKPYAKNTSKVAAFFLFGVALKATWDQATLTSESLLWADQEESTPPSDLAINLLSGLIFFPGLAAELTFINMPHVLSFITGTAEDLTQKVTNQKADSFSSNNQKYAFLLFTCSIHLAQSFLYSEVESGWLNPLSIAAFTALESVAHLDHAMVFNSAKDTFNKRSQNAKIATFLSGVIIGGTQEASTAILALIHFRGSNPAIMALIGCCATVEFGFGFLEHQVHAAPRIEKWTDKLCQSPVIGPSIYADVLAGPQAETEAQAPSSLGHSTV